MGEAPKNQSRKHDDGSTSLPSDDLRHLLLDRTEASKPLEEDWSDGTERAPKLDWVAPEDDSEPASEGPEWRDSDSAREEQPRQIAHPDPRLSYRLCQRCGVVLNDDDKHCPSCGVRISSGSSAAKDQHPPAVARIGRPAGFLKRALAFIIDYLIVLVALSLLWPLGTGEPLVELDDADRFLNTIGAVIRGTQPQSIVTSSDEAAAEDALTAANRLQRASLVTSMILSIYQATLIAIWGTTAGKRILNIYVVNREGRVISGPRSAIRATAGFISLMVFYIGFLFVLIRSDRRSLHDLIADSYPVIAAGEEKPARNI